ncbi:hypothetical protein [Spartinivicinus ruber]|uniref:hypothetical protein n=1 Tax=Spartinivicinus ruber TaxID=2683272 RepID=UPI0013D3BCD3|nr:hypothetical protein [Spartinivicinus ruber]
MKNNEKFQAKEKELAGLLLAISTTATTQFVVEDEILYHFEIKKELALADQLEIGDVEYADKLELCIDSKEQIKNTELLNTKCQVSEEPYIVRLPLHQVESLFGYTSYKALAQGVFKNSK